MTTMFVLVNTALCGTPVSARHGVDAEHPELVEPRRSPDANVPPIAVVSAVIAVAEEPLAVMTPPLIVIVVPSGLTTPSCEVVAVVAFRVDPEKFNVDPSVIALSFASDPVGFPDSDDAA